MEGSINMAPTCLVFILPNASASPLSHWAWFSTDQVIKSSLTSGYMITNQYNKSMSAITMSAQYIRKLTWVTFLSTA